MKTSASHWQGQARMGLGWGEFIGVTGDNSPHSHHAVQVLLSETPQRLWTAASGWQDLYGAVLGPGLTHQLGSNGQPVRLLYVEPHSDAGRCLLASVTDSLRMLKPRECRWALKAVSGSDSPDLMLADVLAHTAPESTHMAGDAAIEAWISALPATLPERITAAACAQQLNLSSSRFQHRFRAHTGLPLRPYLRWRRLLMALREAMQGRTLTDAAHAAGFADAAHFTRTFRRHFGLAPSALVGMRPAP